MLLGCIGVVSWSGGIDFAESIQYLLLMPSVERTAEFHGAGYLLEHVRRYRVFD